MIGIELKMAAILIETAAAQSLVLVGSSSILNSSFCQRHYLCIISLLIDRTPPPKKNNNNNNIVMDNVNNGLFNRCHYVSYPSTLACTATAAAPDACYGAGGAAKCVVTVN